MSGLGGRAQPGDRFDIVPRLTVATLVIQSENELRVPVILPGGPQEPGDSFRVFTRLVVQQAERELRVQVARLGSP